MGAKLRQAYHVPRRRCTAADEVDDERGMMNDEWKAAWMMKGAVLLILHSAFIIHHSSFLW
jgi:hypothetical protein